MLVTFVRLAVSGRGAVPAGRLRQLARRFGLPDYFIARGLQRADQRWVLRFRRAQLALVALLDVGQGVLVFLLDLRELCVPPLSGCLDLGQALRVARRCLLLPTLT